MHATPGLIIVTREPKHSGRESSNKESEFLFTEPCSALTVKNVKSANAHQRAHQRLQNKRLAEERETREHSKCLSEAKLEMGNIHYVSPKVTESCSRKFHDSPSVRDGQRVVCV